MTQEFPASMRPDVLLHARSRASGANVHKVESRIQVYMFACERLQELEAAVLLMPRSADIRGRLNKARLGVERIEAELRAI
jgi:hypothetical protein